MFHKKEKMNEDINIIRNNIYDIIQKNQGVHTQILLEMSKQQKDIFNIGQTIENNIKSLDVNIKTLENCVHKLQVEENKIFENIKNLGLEAGSTMQTDISKIHSKTKLEGELSKIEILKQQTCGTLNMLRSKKENMLLNFDNIFFDNTVMFDLITKNFAKLKELIIL
jgi:hypothetical protein